MVQDTSTLHTFEIMAFSMRGNHRHDISRLYTYLNFALEWSLLLNSKILESNNAHTFKQI